MSETPGPRAIPSSTRNGTRRGGAVVEHRVHVPDQQHPACVPCPQRRPITRSPSWGAPSSGTCGMRSTSQPPVAEAGLGHVGDDVHARRANTSRSRRSPWLRARRRSRLRARPSGPGAPARPSAPDASMRRTPRTRTGRDGDDRGDGRGGAGAGGPPRSSRSSWTTRGRARSASRVTANGLCHSDHWAIANGNWGAPWPMLLGHEGAGIVEAVGPGVTGARARRAGPADVGDAVRRLPVVRPRPAPALRARAGTSRRGCARRTGRPSPARSRSAPSPPTWWCTRRRRWRSHAGLDPLAACLLGLRRVDRRRRGREHRRRAARRRGRGDRPGRHRLGRRAGRPYRGRAADRRRRPRPREVRRGASRSAPPTSSTRRSATRSRRCGR